MDSLYENLGSDILIANYYQNLKCIKYISFFFHTCFLGSIKSKFIQNNQVSTNNDELDYTTHQTDKILNSDHTVTIFCIANNLFSKKPAYNDSTKTLHIFADKNIVIKPRERKVIHTDEEFYLSEFLYNFGTINSRYVGTFLSIEFNNLNEHTLKQNLKITLRNLSYFTYKISKDAELGKIIFATDKKINFQLLNTCTIAFDPLTKQLLKNVKNSKRESK